MNQRAKTATIQIEIGNPTPPEHGRYVVIYVDGMPSVAEWDEDLNKFCVECGSMPYQELSDVEAWFYIPIDPVY